MGSCRMPKSQPGENYVTKQYNYVSLKDDSLYGYNLIGNLPK